MPKPEVQSIWLTDHRCPKCGDALASNGEMVWCSMLRPDTGKPEAVARACLYGIKPKVTVEQHKEGL
jgi:hypothetical protein